MTSDQRAFRMPVYSGLMIYSVLNEIEIHYWYFRNLCILTMNTYLRYAYTYVNKKHGHLQEYFVVVGRG